jgi:hypothetical protein
MRKLFVTTISALALIGVTVNSFGQGPGRLEWSNSNSTASSGSPAVFGNGPNAGSLVTGPAGTYEYGLYVGAVGATSITQMTLVSTFLNNSNSLAKGLIIGGVVTLPSAYPNGTAISDMVAGWTAADGNNYLSATYANPDDYSGLSSVGSMTLIYLPLSVFGHGPGQITGLILEDMPEPGAVLLGGLGAAAMLLFRRKK